MNWKLVLQTNKILCQIGCDDNSSIGTARDVELISRTDINPRGGHYQLTTGQGSRYFAIYNKEWEKLDSLRLWR